MSSSCTDPVGEVEDCVNETVAMQPCTGLPLPCLMRISDCATF